MTRHREPTTTVRPAAAPGRRRHRRCATAPSTATGAPTAWRAPVRRCSSCTASATAPRAGCRSCAASPSDHTVIAPDLLGHGESDKPRADYSVAAYANGMRDLLDVLGIEPRHRRRPLARRRRRRPDRLPVPRAVRAARARGRAGASAATSPRSCGWRPRPLAEVAPAPAAAGRWSPAGRAGARSSVLAVAGQRPRPRRRRRRPRVSTACPTATPRRPFTRTLRSVVDWRGQVVTHARPLLPGRGRADAASCGATATASSRSAHAHLAHEAMPGSRLEIFAGAGHFPHHADPDRFVGLAARVRRHHRARVARPRSVPGPAAAGPRSGARRDRRPHRDGRRGRGRRLLSASRRPHAGRPDQNERATARRAVTRREQRVVDRDAACRPVRAPRCRRGARR